MESITCKKNIRSKSSSFPLPLHDFITIIFSLKDSPYSLGNQLDQSLAYDHSSYPIVDPGRCLTFFVPCTFYPTLSLLENGYDRNSLVLPYIPTFICNKMDKHLQPKLINKTNTNSSRSWCGLPPSALYPHTQDLQALIPIWCRALCIYLQGIHNSLVHPQGTKNISKITKKNPDIIHQ